MHTCFGGCIGYGSRSYAGRQKGSPSMMHKNRKLLIDGFEFELTGFFSEGGLTTMTVSVSGNGESPADLKGWVLEMCAKTPELFENVEIVSCEKRRRHGSWGAAAAVKTSFELYGDIGISGVAISDWIGRYQEDPDAEYRIVFDKELAFEPFSVALIYADRTRVSEDKISIQTEPQSKIWATPTEKNYCLYIVVPDGYKPVNVCKANISVTKRMVYIAHVKNDETEKSEKPVKAVAMGAVRVVACVPLKSAQASGDDVQIGACDCFEVCETIGYADDDTFFDMRDIVISPKPKSLDLTLLNAHCGKSVYRLDGKFVIDCKHCE